MSNNKNNTTTMNYIGQVNMKIKIKGQVYDLDTHNEGLAYLKYMFAKALLNDLNRWDTPGYINIVKVVEDGEQDFLTKPIAISASQLEELQDGYYTAITFTSYIPASMLINTVDATSTDVYYVYLLTHADTTQSGVVHKLARFNIRPAVLSYITPGTTATLNWTLCLVNEGE